MHGRFGCCKVMFLAYRVHFCQLQGLPSPSAGILGKSETLGFCSSSSWSICLGHLQDTWLFLQYRHGKICLQSTKPCNNFLLHPEASQQSCAVAFQALLWGQTSLSREQRSVVQSVTLSNFSSPIELNLVVKPFCNGYSASATAY